MSPEAGPRDVPAERRLAAILAADVVGYSRLMGADELGTLRAVKAMRADIIDPLMAVCRGRIVKTTGDGLLAEFGSVVDAVGCAVAIQRDMLNVKSRSRSQAALTLRIGVNIGDIIIDGGDIFGDGVNVAARLESICEPGGVAMSRAVHEQVRDKIDLPFVDLGEKSVKNIARPLRIFGLSPKAISRIADAAALPAQPEPSWEEPAEIEDRALASKARPRWKKWRLRLILLVIAAIILWRQTGVQHAFENFMALVRTTPASLPPGGKEAAPPKQPALAPLPPPIIVPSKPGASETPAVAPEKAAAPEKPAPAVPEPATAQAPQEPPSAPPPDQPNEPIGPPLELHPQN
jgi:class 3 adenylate cyclase